MSPALSLHLGLCGIMTGPASATQAEDRVRPSAASRVSTRGEWPGGWRAGGRDRGPSQILHPLWNILYKAVKISHLPPFILFYFFEGLILELF